MPARLAASCAFCSAVSPENLSLNSSVSCDIGFILPLESVSERPSLFMDASTVSEGFARFVSKERKDVPACEAFIPLLAISPTAAATSSAL